jgi:hypothetical protein
MQAFSPSPCRTAAQRAALIVVAVLAIAALAAGAAYLEPPERSGAAIDPDPGRIGRAPAPPVSASDPSLPSAASAFRDRRASPEEPVVTF